MALTCRNGARECTACRLCMSAAVCEICGERIPDGKKYYELSDTAVCEDCAEIIISDGSLVCSLCGANVNHGENLMLFNGRIFCSHCTALSEFKKNYV